MTAAVLRAGTLCVGTHNDVIAHEGAYGARILRVVLDNDALILVAHRTREPDDQAFDVLRSAVRDWSAGTSPA